MNDIPAPEFRPPQSFHAEAGSHVGQQIGTNHGDINNNYTVDPDASPEKKFETGLWYLRGGLREQAEELICEAIAKGHVSAQSLYYWSLSILSRRSVQDLSMNDMTKLSTIERLLGERRRGRATDAADAPYRDAADFVMTLRNDAFGKARQQGLRQDTDEVASRRGEAGTAAGATTGANAANGANAPAGAASANGAAAATAVAAELDGLPDDRRSEVQDHLRAILSGVARDRLDKLEDEDIRAHRMDRRRKERVPLFFQPDPLRPVPVPTAERRPSIKDTAALVFGALLLLGGLWVAFGVMFSGSVGLAVGGLLLVLAGTTAAVRFGMDRAWSADRLRQEDRWRRNGGPATRRHAPWAPAWDPSGHSAKEADFRRTIDAIIDRRFADELTAEENRPAWHKAAAVVRSDLGAELYDLYYDPDADPWRLDWLIQLRAHETAELWRAGRLPALPGPKRVAMSLTAGFAAGLAVLAIGLYLAGTAAGRESVGRTAGAALLLAAGGYLAVRGGYPRYAEQRRRDADRREFGRRHAHELGVYEAWRDFLAEHRPMDWEMGRWLDYDLRHLRREALQAYDLRNLDVIYDFFVVEAGDDSVRAKVRYGPARHSSYRIHLYVMTARSIRQGEWPLLDFAAATHTGRSDSAFPYDSISSVRVTRVSHQLTDSREETVAVQPDGSLRANPQADALTLDEALIIERNSGHTTTVRVENYTKLLEEAFETLDELRRLALESSGISTASRILLAVAAEGRDWFAQQRLRSSQKFAESQEQEQEQAQAQEAQPQQSQPRDGRDLPDNVRLLPPPDAGAGEAAAKAEAAGAGAGAE